MSKENIEGESSKDSISNSITSNSPTSPQSDRRSSISHIVDALSPNAAVISPTNTTVTSSTISSPEQSELTSTLHNLESSDLKTTVNENINKTNDNSNDNKEGKPNSNEETKLINEQSNPIVSIKSQPGVNFIPTDEFQASFTGVKNKNTDPVSMVLPETTEKSDPHLKSDRNSSSSGSNVINGIGVALGMFNDTNSTANTNNDTNEKNHSKNNLVKSSPLLSSTPPTVSKSLIRSYPFLILVLKVLNILTWNDDSKHLSIFLVLLTTFSILYYKPLIIYLGHLLPVFSLWVYSECKAYIKEQQQDFSTLDDIIQTITLISQRADILVSPIVELDLTAGDLKRLLFTTVFLSPIYVVISFFILPPNKMLLSLSFLVLTYHSKWSKITRSLLWKSRSFRLLCFYLTGLDFENSGLNKTSTLFNLNKKLSSRFGKSNNSNSPNSNNSNNSKSSVCFTYVIYENQRRWLGVGWTPNLLSYERTPWTDEFLNESEPIDSFELPVLPLSIDLQDNEEESVNTKGMVWRWVDKTWRLDLTNDGAIQLPSTKPRTTANPKADSGWIYYDNTWKNPSTEDGFAKYTRRRRWIRTAELVYVGKERNNAPFKLDSKGKPSKINNETSVQSTKSTGKSVNFADSSDKDNDFNESDSNISIESKTRKGGLKKSDSGEVKKRKSLRFEEPV